MHDFPALVFFIFLVQLFLSYNQLCKSSLVTHAYVPTVYLVLPPLFFFFICLVFLFVFPFKVRVNVETVSDAGNKDILEVAMWFLLIGSSCFNLFSSLRVLLRTVFF